MRGGRQQGVVGSDGAGGGGGRGSGDCGGRWREQWRLAWLDCPVEGSGLCATGHDDWGAIACLVVGQLVCRRTFELMPDCSANSLPPHPKPTCLGSPGSANLPARWPAIPIRADPPADEASQSGAARAAAAAAADGPTALATRRSPRAGCLCWRGAQFALAVPGLRRAGSGQQSQGQSRYVTCLSPLLPFPQQPRSPWPQAASGLLQFCFSILKT